MEHKKKETVKMLGRNITVQDSDDEESDYISRLLKETDPSKERKKESIVSSILKF